MRATLGRYGLLVPLLAGALLLAVAEFFTLYDVVAITASLPGAAEDGRNHHGYALLVIALALVPMAIGAVAGGSRPAAFACLVLSIVAIVVVLAVDLSAVTETGLTENYEDAEAQPETGFYLESLGAALALIGSVGTLVLRPGAPDRGSRRPPRERPGVAA